MPRVAISETAARVDYLAGWQRNEAVSDSHPGISRCQGQPNHFCCFRLTLLVPLTIYPAKTFTFAQVFFRFLLACLAFDKLNDRLIDQLIVSVFCAQDLLMQCWLYKPDDRPEFKDLLQQIERLPKKKLSRSPSHPVQLSRSADSVLYS